MKPQQRKEYFKTKNMTKNVTKATNYVIIAVLAGSILFMLHKVSTIIVHVYDIGDKKEIGMYFAWCIVLAITLYHNL
jgi:hypothetical protein